MLRRHFTQKCNNNSLRALSVCGIQNQTFSSVRFTSSSSSTDAPKKSFLPLAQVSPAVLAILHDSSSATNINNHEHLSQNEQRELALIQRFIKLGPQKKHDALLTLCATGKFEVVPFALAAGCNPAEAINKDTGASPLFYAVAHGHVECARKFLELLMSEKDGDSLVAALGPVTKVVVSPNNGDDDATKQQEETTTTTTTSAILEAIRNGHEEIVKFLAESVPAGISSAFEYPEKDQEKKASVTDEQKFQHHQKIADEIILSAVQSGKAGIIRALFSEEATKLNPASTCMDPLAAALTSSKFGPSQYTVFWLACMQGNAPVVGAILDCAAAANASIDLNAKTAAPNEMSALSIACLQGHSDVVRTLLTRNTNSATSETRGLDVNIRSATTMGRTQNAGDTPLMIAVTQAAIASKSAHLKPQQERFEEIVRMLIEEPECKIDLARGESDDMSPLLVACGRDCHKLVSMLLEAAMKMPCNPNKRVDIAYQSKKSELTPLLAAAYVGNEQSIAELLTAADTLFPTSEDKNKKEEMLLATIGTTKQNILHLAISNGHTNLVESMVKKIVFPVVSETTRQQLLEGRTIDLVTPLLYALHKQDIKSVEILADAGAEIEHEGVNLAGVCETEEGMGDYAKILRRAEIRKAIAKKEKKKKEEEERMKK